jgi:hypothetical protein
LEREHFGVLGGISPGERGMLPLATPIRIYLYVRIIRDL